MPSPDPPLKDLIKGFFKNLHLGKVFAIRLRRPSNLKGRTQRSSTTTHHELRDNSIPVDIPMRPDSPAISSSTSSRGDSSTRRGKASDMAQAFLPFVQAIAGPIPLVGAPIHATIGGLLEIFKAMDRRGQNKVDLDSLASRLDRLRLDLCNAPRARNHRERSRRENLTSMLLEISATLTELRKRSLAYPSVTQDIAGCFTKIDRYMAEYLLSLQMQNGDDIWAVLAILQRQQEDHQRQHEDHQRQQEILMRIESRIIRVQSSVGPVVTLGFVTLVDATGRQHPIPMDVCDSFERFDGMLRLLLKHNSIEAQIQRRYMEQGQYDLCIDDDKQVTRLTSHEWPSIEAGTNIVMRVIIEQQAPSYSEVYYRCPFCGDVNSLDVGPVMYSLERQAGCSIDCRACKQRFQISRKYSGIQSSNIDSDPTTDAQMRLIRNFHVQQTDHVQQTSNIIKPSDVLRQSSYPVASGGIGDVYKCIWDCGASSDEVAVKSPRFPILSDRDLVRINKNMDREVRIWTALKHRYVLPLHGTVEHFGPFRALVSPWMPNGTLNAYLIHAGETLSMIDRLRLLKQITEGLQYLHYHNVIHGDLTNTNVLVAADGSPRLVDYGISNIMVQSNPAFSYHTSSVRWVAPELVDTPEDQPMQFATKSTDIYALGGIMLQVLYGKQPYWWLKSDIHIISSKFRHAEPINSSIEIQPNHLDFMRRCWSTAKEVRPSVEEVFNYLQDALSNETPSV
ncbi:kinase-like domain-containing protein [Suillus americanus]|nr:kinase-like domain-containing protein [Suillus americanus]